NAPPEEGRNTRRAAVPRDADRRRQRTITPSSPIASGRPLNAPAVAVQPPGDRHVVTRFARAPSALPTVTAPAAGSAAADAATPTTTPRAGRILEITGRTAIGSIRGAECAHREYARRLRRGRFRRLRAPAWRRRGPRMRRSARGQQCAESVWASGCWRRSPAWGRAPRVAPTSSPATRAGSGATRAPRAT